MTEVLIVEADLSQLCSFTWCIMHELMVAWLTQRYSANRFMLTRSVMASVLHVHFMQVQHSAEGDNSRGYAGGFF